MYEYVGDSGRVMWEESFRGRLGCARLFFITDLYVHWSRRIIGKCCVT